MEEKRGKEEMRKMRLQKREITDGKELREILDECEVVRIGTTDSDGMFVVPVNFGYEFQEDEMRLTLYIHGSKEGRKAEAFAFCPQVAVEMDCGHRLIRGADGCSYSYAYSSIMGNGTICQVTDEKEKFHGLSCLMNHLGGGKAPIRPESLGNVAVYRINVHTFTGKHNI